jgi:16S rRNA (guanine1207-N2)-methyltransferase
MIDRNVLDTLALMLAADGPMPLPATGDILVLKAEPDVLGVLPEARVLARTTFKPHHDALARRGVRLVDLESGAVPTAPLVLVCPPRQRDELRALFARALIAAPEGAVIAACLPNTLGAKTAEKILGELAGETQALSKNKCRAFWTIKHHSRFDRALAEDWIARDQPQEIAEGDLISRPGLFSWDRIDPGSVLLADSVPEVTRGLGADFGAGTGFLAREVLSHCRNVTGMHLYEAEHRALACAAANLAAFDNVQIAWTDVTEGGPDAVYDFIVMNPPFHTGRADAAGLGQAFIRAAARALKPGGTLWMVANRHLPYEGELAACFKSHEMLEDEAGYKVIRAERPKRAK